MRGIPIGVQSFTKVRDLNLYYVDKTDLIDSILNDAGTEVFLYTRPRRFEKCVGDEITNTLPTYHKYL